jgi:hypothetical protein
MVCDRTEGWPAGIQLAGLSLVSKSARSESIQPFARLVVGETGCRSWAAQASHCPWWRTWKSIPPPRQKRQPSMHTGI